MGRSWRLWIEVLAADNSFGPLLGELISPPTVCHTIPVMNRVANLRMSVMNTWGIAKKISLVKQYCGFLSVESKSYSESRGY